MEAILETPKTTIIGKRMVNYYLDKIDKFVGLAQILEACDKNAIIVQDYNVVYKTFKGIVKSASNGGLKISCLPNAHQVNLL